MSVSEKTRFPVPPETTQRTIELYAQGYTVAQVAMHVGVRASTITRCVERAGWEARPQHLRKKRLPVLGASARAVKAMDKQSEIGSCGGGS